MKCFFQKHLNWDELQRLNEGFISYFCMWGQTSVKNAKPNGPNTVTPSSPKGKNPSGGIQIKPKRKECSSKSMASTLNMQRIHSTSPGIKHYRRNLSILIVVCWFTKQANSSSLSTTQYFNPFCNKTYKIPLALLFFPLKKNVKNTAEYTSHQTNRFWKFLVHMYFTIYLPWV